MTAINLEYETYSEMFAAYLAEQSWITAADVPLVFHVRQLCKQIDAADLAVKAAHSSAYLQAFSRLDKRRPGHQPTPGDLPGQGSIFDELED